MEWTWSIKWEKGVVVERGCERGSGEGVAVQAVREELEEVVDEDK